MKKNQLDNLDNLSISLILSQTNPSQIEECISPDEMALFNNKQLSRKRTKAIFDHLNACSDCYTRWLNYPPMPENQTWLLPHLTTLLNNAYDLLLPKSPIRPIQFAPALAMAIIVLFVLFHIQFPVQNHLEDLLELPSVTITNQENIDQIKHIQFPWEVPFNAYQSFSPSSHEVSSIKKAFNSGMWHARHDLLKNHDQSQLPDFFKITTINDLKSFYLLGRWCVLFQMACIEKTSFHQFWHNQADIIQILKQQIMSFNDYDLIIEKLSIMDDQFAKTKDTHLSKKDEHELLQVISQIIWFVNRD